MVLLTVWWLAYTAAQDQSATAFEVAAMKPVDPTVKRVVGVRVYPEGRVRLTDMSLRDLVATAFRLPSWQVSGGEDWTRTERWVIEANPPETEKITNLGYTTYTIEDERLRQMLQVLLLERFRLETHREAKTGDVYHLTRTDKPLRLIRTGTLAHSGPENRSGIGYGSGRWVLQLTTMRQLAEYASLRLRAPVGDQTELTGTYDYRQLEPDQDSIRDSTTSFFRMLKDVGLELNRATGSVEMLIIDRAARPSITYNA